MNNLLVLIKKIFIRLKPKIKPSRNNNECIIFGSGPSIDNIDLSEKFFKDKDLIGCNYVHKNILFKNISFKFYSMIDRDYSKTIGDSYFQSLKTDYFITSTKNAYLFKFKFLFKKNFLIIKTMGYENKNKLEISKIISGDTLFTGNSVPFLIACAAFVFNYKVIYLYGIDHYNMQDIMNNNFENSKNYEGRNIKKLAITKEKLKFINSLYSYIYKLCLKRGITVYNMTQGTKLDIIPRIEQSDIL